MFTTRRGFLVFTILFATVARPVAVTAQSPPEMRSSIGSPQRCHDVDPVHLARGPVDRFDRSFAGSEVLPAVEVCDDSAVTAAPVVDKENDTPVPLHSADSPVERPDFTVRLGGQPSIRASGDEGAAIARARAAVLEILRSSNSCSTWFAKSDPDVVETFASLQFWVEKNGPDHIVKERGDRGDWIEHGPYVARTSQSTGRGTNVAINAHGAFFQNKAEVFKIGWEQGYELPTNTWQPLHAGPYQGATAKAQILTLLHEFAHIVGAIPSDGTTPAGLNRSQENTETILKYCKTSVNSSSSHAIIELAQKLPQ